MAIEIEWGSVGLGAALGLVLAALYSVALSTERGRKVCERRTHWTVIGGHLLMALTMFLVSVEVAGLWLAWSVVHGVPLVIRSEVIRWRESEERVSAYAAGLQAAMRGTDEASRDSGAGNGYGGAGAGG